MDSHNFHAVTFINCKHCNDCGRSLQMKLLTIDPSIRFCGMSVWELDQDAHTAKLISYDCLSNHSSNAPMAEWRRAAVSNANALEPYIETCDIVLLEQPFQWGNSARSLMAAKTQALTKLIEFCGMITFLAAKYDKPYHTLTPQEWKGNMKKEITTARINLKMNTNFNAATKEHNIADAIGLGIKWLQNLKYDVLPCE